MIENSRQGMAPALIVTLALTGASLCSGLAQAQPFGPPLGVNGAQPAPRNTVNPVAAAPSTGPSTQPARSPPIASDPATPGSVPARAPPSNPTTPTTAGTDVEDSSGPAAAGAPPADGATAPPAPAANNGPYVVLGAVTAVILAAMAAMFLLFTSRFGALRREIASVQRDEPEPLAPDHSFLFDPRAAPPPRPWTERLAGVKRDIIPTVAPPEQVLAAGSDGHVDMPAALSGMAHDVSALINHAFNADETMNLLRRAIERSVVTF